MVEIPSVISSSALWQTTLAQRSDDPFTGVRERLRYTFLLFRERAAVLAGEVRRDLPELTVHDVTHLDSLWEVASTIVGDAVILTPVEAFVLGGSFLLHDLAMSVAATPGGYTAIRADPRWADLVHAGYWSTYGRQPSASELVDPEQQIARATLFNILRQVHAENAERLAFLSYPSSDNVPLFLLEDTELRQTFGRPMGRIAHSHWWSVTEIERQFTRVIGAPHWCPPEWTVDPLKLACILRVADAAHIDARRAPTYLKAVSRLSASSEQHWRFQEKLNKSYLADDALVFTSGAAFKLSEASAWWLCLETLRMVDRELRAVDALLADRRQPRFAARRVAGVDLPERLTAYVQTDAWLPINATVHVSDLPRVIRSLGGEELYGRSPQVALRELVQNACDAVRARRAFERRATSFGAITVRVSKESSGAILEVVDTGIGMSQRVLTEFLLDFGRTFWGTPEMQEELPGLMSGGLRTIGKYGIGFFSVFMIADQVQISTRRPDSAAHDTLILEFGNGLEGRPVLRPAAREEQLVEGGTCVRLWLKQQPESEDGLLYNYGSESAYDLVELCRRICPAIDVDLFAASGVNEATLAVGASDWVETDGYELLRRVDITTVGRNEVVDVNDLAALRRRAGANLRVLRDSSGGPVGRAAITVGYGDNFHRSIDIEGVVAVGGLRACTLSGITGILIGTPERAARDSAMPVVEADELKRWAEEQVALIPDLWNSPVAQAACAQYVRMCGGHTGALPIAQFRGRWISAEDIERMSNAPDEVVILDRFTADYNLPILGDYVLSDNVIVTASSGLPGLLQSRSPAEWPSKFESGLSWQEGQRRLSLAGAVIEALVVVWQVDSRQIAITVPEREDDVEVGIASGKPIRTRAFRVSKHTVSK